jgi:hypothetical protein
MSKITSIAFVLVSAVCAIGCDEDPVTTIDRNTDCAAICDKYRDCVQGDYDVDECTDQCQDMTEHDETDKIDECEQCLDDNSSCVDKVSSCTDDCAGIIARSSN